MVKSANELLKKIQKTKDYWAYDRITGQRKGVYFSRIRVYVHNAKENNIWGLKTFKDFAGTGYLINKTETINQSKNKNKSIMATKKATVKGLKKVCSHVVKATGLKVDGTLKKGYKYVKGGKIVKTATPVKKPVAKKKVVKKPVAKKKPAVKKKAAKKKAAKK